MDITNFHLFGSSNPYTPVLLKPLCTMQIRHDTCENKFAFLWNAAISQIKHTNSNICIEKIRVFFLPKYRINKYLQLIFSVFEDKESVCV